MQHRLKISLDKNAKGPGIVRCRKLPLWDRVLRRLLGESNGVMVIVPGNTVRTLTMLKVSEELLNDSVFNLETYIATEFARRIGNREEEAFFIGDGAGKPTSVFAAVGGAELGVTAASATAITADELIDLFYSLKSPYRKKAVFVTNDATVNAIRKLKDNQGQYLWQPSITAGEPDTILNRPVKTSAYGVALIVWNAEAARSPRQLQRRISFS